MRAARKLRNALVRGTTAAILAHVALGCAPSSTPAAWTSGPTLFVTPELVAELPEVAAALVKAADIWCRRGYACVRVVVGRGANEARIIDDWKALPDLENKYSVAVTRVRPWSSNIYFLRRYYTGDPITYSEADCDPPSLVNSPLWIATHELGHFVGVSHSADKRSVMYPDASCKFTFVP